MIVSIITPSYNSIRYIHGTIDCVLNQTWKPIEHIVVDGNSTDGTVELLSSYSHLKWVSEPDRGMYDAINKGLRMASGEIVAYLNVDDRYYQETVQTAVETFVANPDIDFIYGYCEYVDERERPLFVLRPPSFEWTRYNLRILWPQPTWFWRKSIHQKVGYFDDSLRLVGDSEFMCRLVKSGCRGKLVRTEMARFMLRDDCISIQDAARRHRESMVLRERYQIHRWSVGGAIAELIFALQNLQTYYHRSRFRWLSTRRSNGESQ